MDRTKLPSLGERPEVSAEMYARDQTESFAPQSRLQAPEGAPNVLVILLDDMGFGASSAFGGPCKMPVAESLSEQGLRYSRFHTTALCSPTRASLMTGRNHHSVGMGVVTALATSAPGYDCMRPATAGTIAQTLNYNGYATGVFGKWHQTPPWEQTAAGPFDRWPTREGFDKFYGILSGGASQFTPTLVDGTTFVEPPATEEEGYHLSEDLVDQACDWISNVKRFAPDKPWFTYLPFPATHAPFHLPESWRDRYRGEFAHGWDKQREITLARQKELGVVPEDTELAPWPEGVPHWDELSDDQRLAAERLMENYAAFSEHTDEQVGRLTEFLRKTGELDNTLIFYILGDNGASGEGGLEGTLNETMRFNGIEDTAERIVSRIDGLGGPESYPHYPVGWALAMDTPYQWVKQVASHYGGTRNGMVVHWPEGFEARGEIRNQWHHVIDIAPTILEVIGLPAPDSIDGIAQDPIDGTSFKYTFDGADAPDRHTTQYFEIHGNRGIYHEGWTAVTKHKTPWSLEPAPAFEDDVWELYDTTSDWSQAKDVAAEHPELLATLQEMFMGEARRFNVLPLDEFRMARTQHGFEGKPGLPIGKSMTLGPNSGYLRESHVPNIKNSSFRVTARFAVSDATADGVLVAQGGRYGGWSLYLNAGVPTFAYNMCDLEITHVRSDRGAIAGANVVDARFEYDGGGVGKGGVLNLFLNGEPVGSGRLERTVPYFFSPDETLNVGIDRGSPITPDYQRAAGNRFTGRIEDVVIAVGDDAVAVSPIDLLDAYMAEQ
ncbi:sulfatase-like hydrolase/transferase [Rhodococcus qingshengii]|uniref:arylsulfatase n=1 Tax=Rhodococcus qingshengii TaxID=334542 RepID=UPI0010A613C2|nr:arylsulfatase [Rhodococcus qingshengii]THJ66922.1 arylsulfatase [Rhodococcus qingshengii]